MENIYIEGWGWEEKQPTCVLLGYTTLILHIYVILSSVNNTTQTDHTLIILCQLCYLMDTEVVPIGRVH